MTKGELKKLLLIIQSAEEGMATLESGGGDVDTVLPKVRTELQDFCVAAGSYGVKGLAQIGERMANFAGKPSPSVEDLTALTFALGLLRRGMQEGSAESIRSAIIETLEILGVEPLDVSVPFEDPDKSGPKKRKESAWMVERTVTEPAAAQVPPVIEKKLEDDTRLANVTSCLGGKILPSDGGSDDSLKMEIPKTSLEKIEFLLSPYDSEDPITQELASENPKMEKILKDVKEFMSSFAGGNLERAQEILEDLSSMQGDGELFNEIGSLARVLHDSISSLASTLDPVLKDLVESKIPDSGDRLEHILKLTETAANTTLDHAEIIQNRIRLDQENLARLEKQFAMLRPIGETARMRIEENTRILMELKDSFSKNIEDLTVILTSQGYQDLTGQVISKMVAFHKEMESKLIGLVRTFGVTVDKEKKKSEGLYGPAHDKVTGALHSQDDVDSLLAEFGF
ncbi:MAG: protein phosphatase CheZ [Syntrophobacteraceae bacterium]